MKPIDNIKTIIKELDAQREDLEKIARLPEEQITEKFHEAVVLPLHSIAARADNMEAMQKGLFDQ